MNRVTKFVEAMTWTGYTAPLFTDTLKGVCSSTAFLGGSTLAEQIAEPGDSLRTNVDPTLAPTGVESEGHGRWNYFKTRAFGTSTATSGAALVSFDLNLPANDYVTDIQTGSLEAVTSLVARLNTLIGWFKETNPKSVVTVSPSTIFSMFQKGDGKTDREMLAYPWRRRTGVLQTLFADKCPNLDAVTVHVALNDDATFRQNLADTVSEMVDGVRLITPNKPVVVRFAPQYTLPTSSVDNDVQLARADDMIAVITAARAVGAEYILMSGGEYRNPTTSTTSAPVTAFTDDPVFASFVSGADVAQTWMGSVRPGAL
jgi:hypothetical protein